VFAARQDWDLWPQDAGITWFSPNSSLPQSGEQLNKIWNQWNLQAQHLSSLSLHHQCRTQCSVFSTHNLMHSSDTTRLEYLLPLAAQMW
jgi:hypothetical protein